jgi:predicted O-methyltransferase YrrM
MAESIDLADALELEHGILCRLPLLGKVRGVPGWLTDAEADLLSAVTDRAVPVAAAHGASLVELGSYCGKSTLAIALTMLAAGHPEVRLVAVDPHDGYEFAQGVDTYAVLLETLRHHDASDCVDVIRARSWELDWSTPVAMLFIDALHERAEVSRDFRSFERWLVPDGFVAFHDHSSAFPGVMALVRELTGAGLWSLVADRGGLVVLGRAT